MSITLITGVPGSGKTLYAISKLLRGYIGATVDRTNPDGSIETIPRILYTNINGLLIEHEQILGTGEWRQVNKVWMFEGENPKGLHNWHEWAKPGAIICYDEFQKSWPPRPNGAPVPPDIQTLDTHRHMGVDFILITQNCMNVDRHILGLVDRHLHVRRVSNMGMAVVYEWDHASKALLYKNSLTKSPWRYDKSVFKLYKSAELHTKQKRKLPGLVWFILFGFAGAAYAWPTLYQRLNDRVAGKSSLASMPADQAKPPPIDALKPGQKTEYVKDGVQYTNYGPPVVPVEAAMPPPPPAPVLAGCFASPHKCGCIDVQGLPMKTEPGFCEAHILGNAVPGQKTVDVSKMLASYDGPPAGPREGDLDVLAFMAKGRKTPSY